MPVEGRYGPIRQLGIVDVRDDPGWTVGEDLMSEQRGALIEIGGLPLFVREHRPHTLAAATVSAAAEGVLDVVPDLGACECGGDRRHVRKVTPRVGHRQQRMLVRIDPGVRLR